MARRRKQNVTYNKLFKCPNCDETEKLEPLGLQSDRVLIECKVCYRKWRSSSRQAFELFRDKVEKRIAMEMQR